MSFVSRHFQSGNRFQGRTHAGRVNDFRGGVFLRRGALAATFCLALTGCINSTPMADLDYATPSGSPFNIALFHDYSYLAHSFGDIGQSAHRVFDYKGSISLNDKREDIAMLANSYASKAVQASHGDFIDPESSTTVEGHQARDHLLRVLENGRDWFPRDAALAQANFDCWQMNAPIAGQEKATAHCKAAFHKVLGQLEKETKAQEATIEAKRKAAKAAHDAEVKKAMAKRRAERKGGE